MGIIGVGVLRFHAQDMGTGYPQGRSFRFWAPTVCFRHGRAVYSGLYRVAGFVLSRGAEAASRSTSYRFTGGKIGGLLGVGEETVKRQGLTADEVARAMSKGA